MRLTRFIIPFLLTLCSIYAQSTRGVFVGSVTDPSGGRVASATVTVTDEARNTATRITTNEDGQYTATNLEPGTYRISVEAQGFKTTSVQGVVLNVNQTERVDVHLQVGDVSTAVEVQSTAPMVQSETTSIGSVVDNRQIQTMPLNGRGNIYSLLALAPGVVRSAQNPVISSAGTWFGNVNMTIDGSANIDFGNERLGPGTPSVDAISEFKVIGNGASAEFGRGGAQIVVATRSGTNQIRGTLFAFNRNRALSAKNFFATGLPKPPFQSERVRRNHWRADRQEQALLLRQFRRTAKDRFYYVYDAAAYNGTEERKLQCAGSDTRPAHRCSVSGEHHPVGSDQSVRFSTSEVCS